MRQTMTTMGWNECKASQRSALRFFLVPLLCCFGIAAQASSAHTANVQRSRHSRNAARVTVVVYVLEAQRFAPLRGKHVGVITNHTGLDAQGRTTIDELTQAPGIQVVALFTPEHGLGGTKDEMLVGIDALVFDVQDAGVRFYTYTATLAYCMEEAAKRKIAFFVLDRPNPLGGEIVEGPMLDADKTNFVGYFPLPVRYGLTIGELAQLFNAENHIGVDLHVIAMKNWHRNYFFESTGIKWIPPSPNLRTTKGSILYPGIEILQNAGVSVGRGTQTPFEEFGAPWLSGDDVAVALNERHLSGVHFVAQPFIPIGGPNSGQRCGGVAIRITDRFTARSMRTGLEIAAILQKLYPKEFDSEKLLLLTGNSDTIQQLHSGATPEKIVASWSASLTAFDQIRRKYFLYK